MGIVKNILCGIRAQKCIASDFWVADPAIPKLGQETVGPASASLEAQQGQIYLSHIL